MSAAADVLTIAQPGALAAAQRSALAVLAIRIGGAGLAYGCQVLLARLMGRADYGVFATVLVLVTVLGHASLWGLSQAACRFLPTHRARGELDLARGFLVGGARFALVSGLATAALAGAVLSASWTSLPPTYLWPLAVALLVLPVFAVQDFAEGVARSFGWVALAIGPVYILRQGLLAAIMASAVLLGAKAEAVLAVGCLFLATTVAVAIQGTMLRRRLAVALPRGPRVHAWRSWGRISLPMALLDLTVAGFNFADVLLLSLFLPPEAVGVYFAATRLVQIMIFVPYAASAATAQRFADAQARGDRALLSALVARSARLSALATLAAGAALLVAAPLLLALFGPGFSASFPALTILVAGVVVQSAFGPAEDLLAMLGGERACALVSVAALAAAVVLNLALIPLFGVVGAATAMAVAGIGRGLGLALVARARLGIATHAFAGAR